jgi:hypothetical protein
LPRSAVGIIILRVETPRRTTPAQRTNSLAKERRWPIRALGLLLLAQAAGLFALGTIYLFRLAPPSELTRETLLSNLPTSLMSGAFNLMGLLGLITSLSFLRLERFAWLYAMVIQGLSLLMALTLYLRGKPFYIYLIMLYGIFMVIYLNYPEVQSAFKPKPPITNRAQDR